MSGPELGPTPRGRCSIRRPVTTGATWPPSDDHTDYRSVTRRPVDSGLPVVTEKRDPLATWRSLIDREARRRRVRWPPHPMFAVIRMVRRSGLPFGRRAIMLHLATHVTRKNAGRNIEVTVAKLAAGSGASARAIERAIASAVDAEVLTVTPRPGDPRGNLYSFRN